MRLNSPQINLITKACMKAARSLIRDFGEIENLQVLEKGPGDFVSSADKRTEKILIEELQKAHPEYGIVTEETGIINKSNIKNRWIIDPIDGTMNFLNGIPQFAISVGYEEDNEMKSGISASGSTSTNIFIPSQGSITATCDNSSTNRVVGFDYSLTVNKQPYYSIGSETPVEVNHINPIQYSASVQIDVDDTFLKSGFSFLDAGREEKTVSFSVKGRDGTTLQNLTIPKASLVSEQLAASSDGAVRLTLNYVGHS